MRGQRSLHPPVPCSHQAALLRVELRFPQREFFIDNLLVRIHFINVMIRWTGLAPWEFESPFPGSLTSTFLTTRFDFEYVDPSPFATPAFLRLEGGRYPRALSLSHTLSLARQLTAQACNRVASPAGSCALTGAKPWMAEWSTRCRNRWRASIRRRVFCSSTAVLCKRSHTQPVLQPCDCLRISSR